MKYLMAKKLFSTALHSFYSSITVDGLERIPKDQPVIFISNHCNAFVDPMLLVTHLDRHVTLTAKSTLSRNPILKIIINAFSVELLSRSRDRRKHESGKIFNSAALQRLQEKLHNKGAVYIFPEGRSHNDAALHRFKTGAAKLALDYAHGCVASNKDNDLLIVPLALKYCDKSVFRSTAGIRVGTPLSMREWLSEHHHNNTQGLTDQFRTMVEDALAIQKSKGKSVAQSIKASFHLSRPGILFGSLEKRLIGTPLSAIGCLLNALPFCITAMLMRIFSSDHDHPASVAIVIGPPVFVSIHCLQFLLMAFGGSKFLALLYLLLLIPGTVLASKAFDDIFGSGSYKKISGNT